MLCSVANNTKISIVVFTAPVSPEQSFTKALDLERGLSEELSIKLSVWTDSS